MNLGLLLTLLTTTLVAILGWYFVHRMAASRDRANKRRELRAQYLIDAYRKLEGTANRGHVEEINEGKAIMESAFADIQLFGSASQVAKAQEFLRQFSANKTVQMNELLADLRQDLRNELDLDSVSKEVLHLRIRKSN